MGIALIIVVTLFLLLMVDLLRWRGVVKRELRDRELVRVRPFSGFITPTRGYRLIEACICQQHGKEVTVVILNRGWLRVQTSVNIRDV